MESVSHLRGGSFAGILEKSRAVERGLIPDVRSIRSGCLAGCRLDAIAAILFGSVQGAIADFDEFLCCGQICVFVDRDSDADGDDLFDRGFVLDMERFDGLLHFGGDLRRRNGQEGRRAGFVVVPVV